MSKPHGATEKPARRRAYHHGDLRRALVDAALEILRGKGPSELTLREAARAAGVSRAAPYRHFADKQALLAAVAARGFRLLGEAMRAATGEAEQTPALRFRALGEAYVQFALRNAALFQLMFRQVPLGRTDYPDLEAAAQETFGLLIAAIRSGQEAGELAEGDAQGYAIAAWCLVHGLSDLLINGQFGEAGASEYALQAALGALFFGLRRPPPEASC